MVLETHMKLTYLDFWEKNLPQKLAKWPKNGPKVGFFEIIEENGALIFPEFVL